MKKGKFGIAAAVGLPERVFAEMKRMCYIVCPMILFG
jgi:hypothetical protein